MPRPRVIRPLDGDRWRRGKKVGKRFKARASAPRRTHRLKLASRKLRRGDHRVRITVGRGKGRLTSTLGGAAALLSPLGVGPRPRPRPARLCGSRSARARRSRRPRATTAEPARPPPVRDRHSPPNSNVVEDEGEYAALVAEARAALERQRVRAAGFLDERGNLHDFRYFFAKVYSYVTEDEIGFCESHAFHYPSSAQVRPVLRAHLRRQHARLRHPRRARGGPLADRLRGDRPRPAARRGRLPADAGAPGPRRRGRRRAQRAHADRAGRDDLDDGLDEGPHPLRPAARRGVGVQPGLPRACPTSTRTTSWPTSCR